MENSLKLQSDVISILRFPLIVLVIFIHSRFNEISINGEIIYAYDYPFYSSVSYLFSNIISGVSVPLFF